MRVEFTVDDGAVQAAFAELARRGADLLPAMDEIGEHLVTSTKDRMDRGVAPDGTPWLPSRRATEQGGQTLKDHGNLYNSLTHNPAADSVEVGTGLHLGAAGVSPAVHQYGATIRAKAGGYLKFPGLDGEDVFRREVTLPARPFIGFDDEDPGEILHILREWLAEAGGMEGGS